MGWRLILGCWWFLWNHRIGEEADTSEISRRGHFGSNAPFSGWVKAPTQLYVVAMYLNMWAILYFAKKDLAGKVIFIAFRNLIIHHFKFMPFKLISYYFLYWASQPVRVLLTHYIRITNKWNMNTLE